MGLGVLLAEKLIGSGLTQQTRADAPQEQNSRETHRPVMTAIGGWTQQRVEGCDTGARNHCWTLSLSCDFGREGPNMRKGAYPSFLV
jgi:hypothetical protein